MNKSDLRAIKSFVKGSLRIVIRYGLGFLVLFYVLTWISEKFHEFQSKKTMEMLQKNEVKLQSTEGPEHRNNSPSFKGNNLHTVWKDAYKDGHQFRATIKRGHNVVSTTKCDKCGHMLYVHNDTKK